MKEPIRELRCHYVLTCVYNKCMFVCMYVCVCVCVCVFVCVCVCVCLYPGFVTSWISECSMVRETRAVPGQDRSLQSFT